ncbi:neuropeptide CCHamide 1 [Musca autumnalis]|uniref:neuropeptide CCHamide 1 n=1 Tax=Musca autumnalis TaxID=221902 RepID=UPI003CF1750B
MAFKTLYCVLLFFLLTFTAAKGSCLEYGHSCWGAHGKRSGNNNKIQHFDKKLVNEVDFADLNAIKEPYDSTEENVKNSYDTVAHKNQENSKTSSDFSNEVNNEKILKLENLLLKRLSGNGKHQMADEIANDNNEQQSPHNNPHNDDANLNYRWRRLPLYNFRHFPMRNDNWLNDLEQQEKPHASGDEDYI